MWYGSGTTPMLRQVISCNWLKPRIARTMESFAMGSHASSTVTWWRPPGLSALCSRDRLDSISQRLQSRPLASTTPWIPTKNPMRRPLASSTPWNPTNPMSSPDRTRRRRSREEWGGSSVRITDQDPLLVVRSGTKLRFPAIASFWTGQDAQTRHPHLAPGAPPRDLPSHTCHLGGEGPLQSWNTRGGRAPLYPCMPRRRGRRRAASRSVAAV